MPKEVVRDEHAGETMLLSSSDAESEEVVFDPELRAEVRWAKGAAGYVSVGTVNERPPGDAGDGAYGWHVGLSRAGCNALIRHLRRARDQAFGRDE